ncbi:MAG: hypothetical protein WD403_01000 [Pirellulales bacterium]
MKVALPVAMILALLSSTSGCCLPGCLGYGRPDCELMGCSQRYWGEWNHDPDPCDHCGNWVGDGCARPAYQAPVYADAELYRQPSWEQQVDLEPGSTIVPGSYRVTTRSGGPTPARAMTVSDRSR